MAYKDILVVIEPGPEGRYITDYALSFCDQIGAHLTVAGVALQNIAPVSFMGDYPYEMMAQATQEAREAAEKAYEDLRNAAPASVQTDFVLIESFTGEAQGRIGELARHFDLTILGQGGPEADSFESGLAVSTLFSSGRPAIVLPYIHKGPAKLDHFLVAWDGGDVAARALGSAMPLLERGKDVELVTVRDAEELEEVMPGMNITRHLARHNIKSELKMLASGNDIASVLLSHAADVNPDMMVMGCYGHSRLREFVRGGTTREILASMTVPVLMSH